MPETINESSAQRPSLIIREDNPRAGSPDNASMPPVSMSLYEVACSRARARSDDSAFLPADQASAYGANDSADNRALSLAVVMSVGALVSQPLGGKCQHNKNEHQQYRYNVLFSISLYHYHPLLLKEKFSVSN